MMKIWWIWKMIRNVIAVKCGARGAPHNTKHTGTHSMPTTTATAKERGSMWSPALNPSTEWCSPNNMCPYRFNTRNSKDPVVAALSGSAIAELGEKPVKALAVCVAVSFRGLDYALG